MNEYSYEIILNQNIGTRLRSIAHPAKSSDMEIRSNIETFTERNAFLLPVYFWNLMHFRITKQL